MTDVQIVRRRWQDVDDRTVVHWNGEWREVLQVYRTKAGLDGEWADADGQITCTVRKWGEYNVERPLAELAAKAFGRVGDDYVLVRLFDVRHSGDEVLDWWLMIYRLELVECQSLPAFTPREPDPQPAPEPRSLSPLAEDKELSRHPNLVSEYHALRRALIAMDMRVPRHTDWRFADGVLTHGTIEYVSSRGQFRLRLQELDEEGRPK